MDKEQIKYLVEKEMDSKFDSRQANLVEGLLESYIGLSSIGLNPLEVIYRAGIQSSIKKEYHSFLATTRKEELSDKFLLSVFCLVLSRPANLEKLKI